MNTHLSLSENKTLEVQLELWDSDETIFRFDFQWSRRTDHAGLNITFAIWRFSFYFSICDNRHWDYDKNTWSTYKGASADTLTEDD